MMMSTLIDTDPSAIAQDRPALIDRDVVIDHRQLRHNIEARASELHSLGLRAGDRCAILAKNSISMIEALLACTALGVIAVPLNTRPSPREIADLVTDADSQLLILDPDLEQVAAAVTTTIPRHPLETPPPRRTDPVEISNRSGSDLAMALVTGAASARSEGSCAIR